MLLQCRAWFFHCIEELPSLFLIRRSQSEQQLHYPSGDVQYPSPPVSMATLPLHPALLERYLPRGLEPPPARAGEGQGAPPERHPYSEGEDSDGGEHSEGELVVLTD